MPTQLSCTTGLRMTVLYTTQSSNMRQLHAALMHTLPTTADAARPYLAGSCSCQPCTVDSYCCTHRPQQCTRHDEPLPSHAVSAGQPGTTLCSILVHHSACLQHTCNALPVSPAVCGTVKLISTQVQLWQCQASAHQRQQHSKLQPGITVHISNPQRRMYVFI